MSWMKLHRHDDGYTYACDTTLFSYNIRLVQSTAAKSDPDGRRLGHDQPILFPAASERLPHPGVLP